MLPARKSHLRFVLFLIIVELMYPNSPALSTGLDKIDYITVKHYIELELMNSSFMMMEEIRVQPIVVYFWFCVVICDADILQQRIDRYIDNLHKRAELQVRILIVFFCHFIFTKNAKSLDIHDLHNANKWENRHLRGIAHICSQH